MSFRQSGAQRTSRAKVKRELPFSCRDLPDNYRRFRERHSNGDDYVKTRREDFKDDRRLLSPLLLRQKLFPVPLDSVDLERYSSTLATCTYYIGFVYSYVDFLQIRHISGKFFSVKKVTCFDKYERWFCIQVQEYTYICMYICIYNLLQVILLKHIIKIIYIYIIFIICIFIFHPFFSVTSC